MSQSVSCVEKDDTTTKREWMILKNVNSVILVSTVKEAAFHAQIVKLVSTKMNMFKAAVKTVHLGDTKI